MFGEKTFNNIYHILDDLLALYIPAEVIKTQKKEVLKNPSFIKIRKFVSECFAVLCDECVDRAPPMTEAEEKAMIVRVIEKNLFCPSFGNAQRQLVLEFVKENSPQCVLANKDKKTYVDFMKASKKELKAIVE